MIFYALNYQCIMCPLEPYVDPHLLHLMDTYIRTWIQKHWWLFWFCGLITTELPKHFVPPLTSRVSATNRVPSFSMIFFTVNMFVDVNL